MNLQMDLAIAEKYNSVSQKVRVITESWVGQNLFCPYCGGEYIRKFENNRPVADFYCPACLEEYELKSKNGTISTKVNDGAYATMMERIEAINNPNFFFMHYGKTDMRVKNFIVVPKYFFTKDIIEKRKALSRSARRAGWVGCNIILSQIPEEGRIFIVKDEKEQPMYDILSKVQRMNFIREYKLDARGWIMDVLNCINRIPTTDFSLEQIYQFVPELELKYPGNHHVREKIRQQLQMLRDKGIIEFKGGGRYRKI